MKEIESLRRSVEAYKRLFLNYLDTGRDIPDDLTRPYYTMKDRLLELELEYKPIEVR